MGSSGKRRTTWAKLNREAQLRDKRVEKQARKAARKSSAGDAEDAPRSHEVGSGSAEFDDGEEPESIAAPSDPAGGGG